MKLSNIYAVITGISYFLWWWALYFFLPVDQVMTDYPALINNKFWLPINLLQILGILSFTLFIVEYSALQFRESKRDIVIKIFFAFAIFGFSGVSFYEAFLWPIIASSNPSLLYLHNSPIYKNAIFLISTGICILSFMIAGIFLGLNFKKQFFKTGIIFIAGIILFCMGYMVGPIRYIVQSVGLSAWTIGLLIYAIKDTVQSDKVS